MYLEYIFVWRAVAGEWYMNLYMDMDNREKKNHPRLDGADRFLTFVRCHFSMILILGFSEEGGGGEFFRHRPHSWVGEPHTVEIRRGMRQGRRRASYRMDGFFSSPDSWSLCTWSVEGGVLV